MDPSIDIIRASDGSGNASVATVQSIRAALATTINVDTVTGIPANFIATMGTPHTFVDPVTSEEITVISEATAVDFRGHVDVSDLEIDEIAPGYTDLGSEVGDIIIIRPTTLWADNVADVLDVSHNDDGTLKVANGGSIKDGNGNEQIKFTQTASAVNELTVKNSAIGNPVELQSTGGDTNIGLKYTPKGSGKPSGFINVKVGTFTTNGTNNIVVTGLGFKPKAIQVLSLFTDITNTARISGGFSDGTTTVATAARAATSGPNSSTQTETDALLLATTTDGGIQIEGTLVSFDDDGFTISVSVGSVNLTFGYMVFG